jgi:hypothetical protein
MCHKHTVKQQHDVSVSESTAALLVSSRRLLPFVHEGSQAEGGQAQQAVNMCS